MAARLRDARYATQLTQRDVAARLDKPPSYVHKVETAERELNVVELLDYCEALEIDALDFLRAFKSAMAVVRQTKARRGK